MTYLNWGCDPLAEECRSCLDAICSACSDESKRTAGHRKDSGHPGNFMDPGDTGDDADAGGLYEVVSEPDCDRCDLERKPDCAHCRIILGVCRDCPDNKTCEFRIDGDS